MTFDEVAPFLFALGKTVENDTHNYVTNALQGSHDHNGQIDVQASWVTLYGKPLLSSF